MGKNLNLITVKHFAKTIHIKKLQNIPWVSSMLQTEYRTVQYNTDYFSTDTQLTRVKIHTQRITQIIKFSSDSQKKCQKRITKKYLEQSYRILQGSMNVMEVLGFGEKQSRGFAGGEFCFFFFFFFHEHTHITILLYLCYLIQPFIILIKLRFIYFYRAGTW